MYQVCMFDLDGTLANTLHSIAFYANQALVRHGLPAIPAEQYRLMVGNGIFTQVHRMLAYYGKDEPELWRSVLEDYRTAYQKNPLHLVEPYPGIVDMLHDLHRLGVRLAVLSNKPDDLAHHIVQQLFGESIISVCLGQREDIPQKPDPAGVHRILQQLGISPEHCLYAGDSGVDMRTGKAAGTFTVGVTWGFRSIEELQENGADMLAHHPREITNRIIACQL